MRLRLALFILFLLVAASTVHLAIYTMNIDLKYEVEGLKRDLLALNNELRALEADAAVKRNLGRIESVAVNKLKMIRPESIHYIVAPTAEITP